MFRIWPFSVSGRSTVYSVHEPSENEGTAIERAERLAFVSDRFSWLALLLGPLHLLVKREWIALGVYVLALVALVNVLTLAGAEQNWISWSVLLLNVVLGFEMSEIRRRSLARAGWREIGTVSGTTAEEAERRFFSAWLATAPRYDSAAPAVPPVAPMPATAAHHDSVSRAGTLRERLSSRLIRKSATSGI